MPEPAQLIHGTAIAVDGAGLLILGVSGAGKSSLALQLIALGAGLIADDQVAVVAEGDEVILRKPAGLPAAIEARGVGVLNAPMVEGGALRAVVDLDLTEAARLPVPRLRRIAGVEVDVIANAPSPHFPSAVLLYLKHGMASGLHL